MLKVPFLENFADNQNGHFRAGAAGGGRQCAEQCRDAWPGEDRHGGEEGVVLLLELLIVTSLRGLWKMEEHGWYMQ